MQIDHEVERSEARWARQELGDLLDDAEAGRTESRDTRRANLLDRIAQEADRVASADDRRASAGDRSASAADREQAVIDVEEASSRRDAPE
ncbi:hypothetical protein EKO23_07715 [Nocardioides guangzhouensis]|uniref:Uncharacterized protein n=1 Tax=Nocardioides guangzhouensis TaxID=2497878 RepID=A0A4Q4ZFG0_9ACTN|nr:hypothetical protein [Nocardioides guangzhouensis]RYP86853.1 hypothetical protein EKO23_07715 [Nocardioides guangzhouensis]